MTKYWHIALATRCMKCFIRIVVWTQRFFFPKRQNWVGMPRFTMWLRLLANDLKVPIQDDQDWIQSWLSWMGTLRSLSTLGPCHYFWNLGDYPSIKSVLKEDYFCSRKSWMDVHRITSLRNCYLWNITSLMIQGLSCLVGFLFYVPKAWSGCSFAMQLNCGTMSVKML